MKPMNKKEFAEFIAVAKKANVVSEIVRIDHSIYLHRGDDIVKIAQGWDIGTAMRHESKFKMWLESL